MIKKFKRIIINFLIKLNLKPFISVELINGFLDFGRFVHKHSEVKKFDNKFKLYDYINSLIPNDPITYIEFGVFRGETILYWSKLNSNNESEFYGFDSFEGLPEEWMGTATIRPKGEFDTGGEIPQTEDKRIHFIKGIFQNTLIPFLEEKNSSFKNRFVIHCDADLYSSEMFCLTQIYKYLKSGSIVIFDDFCVVNHDYKAMKDWTHSHLIDYKVLGFTIPRYVQAAVEITELRKNYK
jgi:O-methyltransferase